MQQKPAQITVEQPAPTVQVQQPKPQVTINQPPPNVKVQQAQPDVNYERQGQPQVQVQQTGQPNVNVEQSGQQSQSANAQHDQSSNAGAAGGSTIATMHRDQLVGKNVYGMRGQEAGEVADVVTTSGGQISSVLVDVGGFLGLGEKRISIPAQELQFNGNRISSNSMTAEQIKNMPSTTK